MSLVKFPSEDRYFNSMLMQSFKSDSRSKGAEVFQQLHPGIILRTSSKIHMLQWAGATSIYCFQARDNPQ